MNGNISKEEEGYPSDIKIKVDGVILTISITKESDLSLDGGYTFEDVTNTEILFIEDVELLINKLNKCLEIQKNNEINCWHEK